MVEILGMKTSKADFKYFKARCEYWIDYLGINDWNVNYAHTEKIDARAVFDPMNAGSVGRECYLALAIEWVKDLPINKESLNQTALHEVVHLLLGEFSCIAESRFITKDELHAAEHALVNRIIKVLI
jgi:hypothetical protein